MSHISLIALALCHYQTELFINYLLLIGSSIDLPNIFLRSGEIRTHMFDFADQS